MKFVNSSKIVSAFSVFMIAVSFNAETASAIELINEPGLLAALRKNKALSEKDLIALDNEYPKLEINGSFQFQYFINSADPVSRKINEMDIKRLNLSVASQVTDKVSLLLEPEYGKGLPLVRDAYVAYKPAGYGIYAGNHRVPFGGEVLKNDINLRFGERSLASQISPDRLVGISVFKKFRDDKIMAQAGMWNSKLNSKAESDLINNKLADNQIFSASSTAGNNIFIKAFRVGSSSKGRNDFYSQANGFNEDESFSKETSVNWGFSYYNSSAATDNPTPGATGLNGSSAFEADLSLRYKKLAGEVEYAKRNLDWWQFNAAAVNKPVSSGQTSYSVQASYPLIENALFLALRHESFVYDGNGKILKGVYGQDQDKWLTLGLNFYSREQNTKIQVNYILKKEVMPSGASSFNNNTTLIQATTYF